MIRPALDAATAARFAAIALENVEREYPNKADHVLYGDADAQPLAGVVRDAGARSLMRHSKLAAPCRTP